MGEILSYRGYYNMTGSMEDDTNGKMFMCLLCGHKHRTTESRIGREHSVIAPPPLESHANGTIRDVTPRQAVLAAAVSFGLASSDADDREVQAVWNDQGFRARFASPPWRHLDVLAKTYRVLESVDASHRRQYMWDESSANYGTLRAFIKQYQEVLAHNDRL